MADPELFELELWGGLPLERYRALRPEIEDLPWGTIDPASISEAARIAAQKAWTGAAFQEFRTGAACAATLEALIKARAPLDLIALAARFPLDEMLHVEICSRIATELGGAIELVYDPERLIWDVPKGSPLMTAAHWVVSNFCVGEALSIPLIQGTSRASTHPLIKQALRRIVVDEADHGTFGWHFLDWADPLLSAEDKRALGHTADRFIGSVLERWQKLRNGELIEIHQAEALGWMGSDEYLKLADHSLRKNVIAPLVKRGIPISRSV